MAGKVPKFTQIVTGEWEGSVGRRSFSVIALGEDGKVYKFEKSGWICYPERLVGFIKVGQSHPSHAAPVDAGDPEADPDLPF